MYDLELQNINHKMILKLNSTNIENIIQKELKILSKNKIIKGFRKGKAPLNLINNLYKKSVQLNVLNNLMKKKFLKEIQLKKINIIGLPKYNYNKYEINKDFIFTVTFQIYPEFNLLKLNNIKINIPTVKIDNNDINNYIYKIYNKKIIWIDKKNQTADLSDRVIIDIFIYMNNYKNKIFTNVKLFLSDKWTLIPNLEPNIIGKKSGDKFNIKVLISNNYPNKQLIGTEQHFFILIKKVETQKIFFTNKKNIFNSNFITNFTFTDLYKIVKKQLQFKTNKMIRYIIKYKVITILVNLHKEIKLPLLLVNSEFNSINKIYKKNKNKFNKLNLNTLYNKAKKYTLIKILINKIITDFKIQFNKNLIIDFIYEELSSYTCYYDNLQLQKIIKYYLINKNLKQKLYNSILEYQAIQVILKTMLVNKIQYSYKDIKHEYLNISLK
ncbi:trigger factor [Enterobacteriaceae endosymbiont of Plateumaris braccata]|uniref:trigger factor n=1 Tax=Enterobacteriaceae endosymbiont of Plateumaris braccata TaxID=2675793 RepID=UPI001448ECDC|nr:trigger factor [Enterobacteriaceae endosymbiont of Plateumaris braccata]QJC28177.1 trigger factor [Enterobacteriaceae endosymbiont of Plateumaris braccata]